MSIVWIIILAFVFVSAVTTAWAAWRAAPYVPTRNLDVQRMLKLAEIQDGEIVYDLGAGDGRLLIAAARVAPNVRAIGYELALPAWLVGRIWIGLTGLSRRASIRIQDFFHRDLSDADVVFCFLTPEAMKKLSPKFRKELKPGTRIISAVFPMKDWPEEVKDKPAGRVAVYRYRA